MCPGRREHCTVQVARQLTAQLDGLPILPWWCSGEAALRGPGRPRLILARRLRLRPFLAMRLQLAAVLALDRVILCRSVRTADLLAHWQPRFMRTAWAPLSQAYWWLAIKAARLPGHGKACVCSAYLGLNPTPGTTWRNSPDHVQEPFGWCWRKPPVGRSGALALSLAVASSA